MRSPKITFIAVVLVLGSAQLASADGRAAASRSIRSVTPGARPRVDSAARARLPGADRLVASTRVMRQRRTAGEVFAKVIFPGFVSLASHVVAAPLALMPTRDGRRYGQRFRDTQKTTELVATWFAASTGLLDLLAKLEPKESSQPR